MEYTPTKHTVTNAGFYLNAIIFFYSVYNIPGNATIHPTSKTFETSITIHIASLLKMTRIYDSV